MKQCLSVPTVGLLRQEQADICLLVSFSLFISFASINYQFSWLRVQE